MTIRGPLRWWLVPLAAAPPPANAGVSRPHVRGAPAPNSRDRPLLAAEKGPRGAPGAPAHCPAFCRHLRPPFVGDAAAVGAAGAVGGRTPAGSFCRSSARAAAPSRACTRRPTCLRPRSRTRQPSPERCAGRCGARGRGRGWRRGPRPGQPGGKGGGGQE